MARRPRFPKLPKEPKAPVVYELSPEVAAVASRLARLFPVQFGWTSNFTVGYLIVRGKKLNLNKREPMAVFKKVPPTYRGLTGFDAVVEVLEEAWALLDATQQEALVAHELCHGSMSEKGALRVEKHDLEEFRFVVAQWGAWDVGIRKFGEQLDLFAKNGPVFKVGDAGEQTKLPAGDAPTPIGSARKGRKPNGDQPPAPLS